MKGIGIVSNVFEHPIDRLRRKLKRGCYRPTDSEVNEMIDMIDMAYCRGRTRLGRAGLRRLDFDQLHRAADHFTRRRWGKARNLSGDYRPWTSDHNPLRYIEQLVGEIVVRQNMQKVSDKCMAAYRQFHESIGG